MDEVVGFLELGDCLIVLDSRWSTGAWKVWDFGFTGVMGKSRAAFWS